MTDGQRDGDKPSERDRDEGRKRAEGNEDRPSGALGPGGAALDKMAREGAIEPDPSDSK